METSPVYPPVSTASWPIFRRASGVAAAAVWFAAGSSGVRAQEGSPPQLSSWGALMLTVPAEKSQTCLLERSTDLLLWEPSSQVYYGGGGARSIIATAEAEGEDAFFRIRLTTTPAGGLARWSMDGIRMMLVTKQGPGLALFNGDQSGVWTESSGSERPFTWDWERTGADTGNCVITWPQGSREAITIHYLGTDAGVFSSILTEDGVSRGLAQGAFCHMPLGDLTQQIPSALEGRQIIFSGTGRPLSVRIAAEGVASVSNGSGVALFSSAYTAGAGSAATLDLVCSDGWAHSFVLEFSGPGCGQYRCDSSLNGVRRREATGVFATDPE